MNSTENISPSSAFSVIYLAPVSESYKTRYSSESGFKEKAAAVMIIIRTAAAINLFLKSAECLQLIS